MSIFFTLVFNVINSHLMYTHTYMGRKSTHSYVVICFILKISKIGPLILSLLIRHLHAHFRPHPIH